MTHFIPRTLPACVLVALLGTFGVLACACQQTSAPVADKPAGARSSAAAASSAKGKASAARVDISLDEMREGKFLLVTHPTKLVVESLETLLERKLLDVPGVTVVGVHHDDEYDDYKDGRKVLRKSKRPWMRMLEIDCKIERTKLFTGNDCTPVFEKLQQRSVGIVFTGGADIPPEVYGEETALTTVIRTPNRQYWEISMLFHLLGGSQDRSFEPLLVRSPSYPVLGICMGMQAMNVATGGTLVQDIPSELYGVRSVEEGLKLDADQAHRSFAYALDPAPGTWPGVFHPIKFTGQVDFWKKLMDDGQPVEVMSVHHQALEKLGKDLAVTATSTDGKVPEAVHHKRYPNVLGIQFHPEYDVLWDRSKRAKQRAGDTETNSFAAALAADARSMRFHMALWRELSSRFAGGVSKN